MCREFPFRFKAACSLSSYLSRVIYFLISLSLPSLPFSLSLCEFIWESRGQRRGGGRWKVNKSLWRQLFPPSVSCLLLALSLLLCFLFVYSLKLLCSSAFPPPSSMFPVSDPLSHIIGLQAYIYSSPQRPIDFILPLTASPTL